MSLLANKEHLPKVVTKVDGVKDVLLAIDPELVLLREDLSQTIKELYVKTTEKYIRLWEDDFGLDHNASLTLQQRRGRILNKLAKKSTLTWENLKKLIKNNIDTPTIYLTNDSSNYKFTVMVTDPDIAQLKRALDNAKPAYLIYELIVTQYFRRCGTFNCGTEPI